MEDFIQVSSPSTWTESLLLAVFTVGFFAVLLFGPSIKRRIERLSEPDRRRKGKRADRPDYSWLVGVLTAGLMVAVLTLILQTSVVRLLTMEVSGDFFTATYQNRDPVVIDRRELVWVHEYKERGGIGLEFKTASGTILRTLRRVSDERRERYVAWAGLPPAPGWGEYRRWER